MSKFKAGDRVRVKDTPMVRDWNKSAIGYISTLTEEDMSGGDYASRHLDNNRWRINFKDEDLELVEENPLFVKVPDKFFDIVDFEWKQNYKIGDIIQVPAKKSFMTNLITTFKNITRTEPNKTFVKAGVMNEELALTSEGKELFIQFMFDKHADEFKKDVVDAILAEQEKK